MQVFGKDSQVPSLEKVLEGGHFIKMLFFLPSVAVILIHWRQNPFSMAMERIYFIFEVNPTLQRSSIGKNPFSLGSETLLDSIREYRFNTGYTEQTFLVSHLLSRILLLLCISSFCSRRFLGKDLTMQRMNYLKDLLVSSQEKEALPAAAEGTKSLAITTSFVLRVKTTEVKRICEKPVQ